MTVARQTECGFCDGDGLTRFHAEWVKCPYCDGSGLAPQADTPNEEGEQP